MIHWSNKSVSMQTIADWKRRRESQCQHPCRLVKYSLTMNVDHTVMNSAHIQNRKSHQSPDGKNGSQIRMIVMSPHLSLTHLETARHSSTLWEKAKLWVKVQRGHQKVGHRKVGHQKVEEKVKLDHAGRAVHLVTPGSTVPTKVQGNQVNGTGSRQIALIVVSGDTQRRHVLGQRVQARPKEKESQKEKEKEAPKVKAKVKVQPQWK